MSNHPSEQYFGFKRINSLVVNMAYEDNLNNKTVSVCLCFLTMSTFQEFFLKIQVQRIQKNENVVHSITPHFKFSLFSVLTHCICSCKITHPNHFKILEFIW